MDARVLLFLIVLGSSCFCDARVMNTNLSPVQNAIASGSSETVPKKKKKRLLSSVDLTEIVSSGKPSNN